MLEIIDLHDEVFQTLLDFNRDLDENLRFTLRKSNRYNKLEEGYWFYGNDDYLAVSFWSGMDWKNKTPNIFFSISQTGRTFLEISVQDSDIKRTFVNQYLKKPLGLEGEGPKYVKQYNPAGEYNYISSLNEFLVEDKRIIDKAIGAYATKKTELGFIDEEDFETRLRHVIELKSANESERKKRPIKLKSFHIKGYGPIKDLSSDNIPFDNQFVFLTGLNGTGKSSIIKALGIGLAQKELTEEELHKKQKFEVDFELYNSKGDIQVFTRKENEGVSPRLKPIILSLAAYGPVRLQTANSDLSQNQLSRAFNKSNTLDSLREIDSYLLDIHTHFKRWKEEPKHRKWIKKRRDHIEEILAAFFDSQFKVKITDSGVKYEEYNDKQEVVGSVPYKNLSTGLRNSLSLLGDLLIRMYEQQPEISDPALFQGVVLIDEIDIHLHPILQKRFVSELRDTFPKIQFIVTTHSPIPLLGAPKNSVIMRIRRDKDQEVYKTRLENKLYLTDLLPNTILTSPIFDLEDIVSSFHEKDRKVRTEKSFDELEFNDKLRAKINSFITDEVEEELIKLFETRRK